MGQGGCWRRQKKFLMKTSRNEQKRIPRVVEARLPKSPKLPKFQIYTARSSAAGPRNQNGHTKGPVSVCARSKDSHYFGGFFYWKENMSKEEIIAAIQECARKLGRAPKYEELIQHCSAAKMGAIRKYIGTYTLALRESGIECIGQGFEIAMDDLFRDWTRVVRKLRKVPNMTEYDHESKYSVRPLMGRFKRWTQMPRGMHEYARQKSMEAEYADVMEMIREYYKDEPESAWMLEKKSM